VPLQRTDAETVSAAFLDFWVAAYGPQDTVLTENGPQFRATFLQGVCSFLGVTNPYSTAYHPQTNGQVERYNRTIVGQLRTYVEDHQDQWDTLVSMLTLAYNRRPQPSTGVAPLEFVTPKRVKSLLVERMVASPAGGPSTDNPRAAREQIRARLRNVIHKVRHCLEVVQRRYKKGYDAMVRPVNRNLKAGDWVFLDGNAKAKQKLGTRAVGPHKVLARGVGTFKLDVGGYPETVSIDRVTAAPEPYGDIQEFIKSRGPPQDSVVPGAHQDTGREYVWEAFLGHEVAEDGTLLLRTRWWGYEADKDTLEPAQRFDRRKVDEYLQGVGLRVEEAVEAANALA